MGCISSKDRQDKERVDEYGFNQTYKQKDLQVRGRVAGPGAATSKHHTLPHKDGGTVDRRSRSNPSQFDPHKDVIIQTLKQEAPYRGLGEGQLRAPLGGEAQGRSDGQNRTIDRRNGTADRREKQQNGRESGKSVERREENGRRGSETGRRDSQLGGAKGRRESTPGDRQVESRRTERPAETGKCNTTPRSRGAEQDNFSRNQFDRASQLRRSKKKKKKSSADQTLSPGVQSLQSPGVQSFQSPGVQSFQSPGVQSSQPLGVQSVKSDKTAESIVSDMNRSHQTKQQSPSGKSAKTEYDPKYGNLI